MHDDGLWDGRVHDHWLYLLRIIGRAGMGHDYLWWGRCRDDRSEHRPWLVGRRLRGAPVHPPDEEKNGDDGKEYGKKEENHTRAHRYSANRQHRDL